MIIDAIDIAGSAHDRGLALGRALAARIAGHVDAWLSSLEGAGLGDARTYVADMLRDTDFHGAVREHMPDLVAEADGIADGADQPRPLMFALQLLDEEWAYRARRRSLANQLQKCSSAAVVNPDGSTWIGQNMDLGGYTDGHQVLLRIAPDQGRPGALVFSTAGMIGLMGVNAVGVAVCVNSLPQLPSAAVGVPVAFMVRRLLQASSLAEAVQLVQLLPHATNQHYLIAEAGAVRSFEASAAGVTEFHPPQADRVLHTNHPLTDEQGVPESESARENSAARLASLTRRLASGRPNLADLQAAFAAFDDPRHPVCRERRADGLINFTTGSMISLLRPLRSGIESWVSAGPPSRGGYQRVEMTLT
ncbi:C45 family peptidase [Phenylobacterium sp.]|uniref:C45 family autoproteolytic acyltransferase/hydolase n=1 Tax=Phenylobacterium sp. TaxID=1871053 RepID=UPI0025F55F15|nr:C45 family peptidase [Phenylobacterium sp.]